MSPRNLLSLAGKIALVTGSAAPQGIGRATAKLFAEYGAKVVVTDLAKQREAGERAVEEIKRAGGDAIFVGLDVSKEDNWVEAIEMWVEWVHMGGGDAIGGILRGTDYLGALSPTDTPLPDHFQPAGPDAHFDPSFPVQSRISVLLHQMRRGYSTESHYGPLDILFGNAGWYPEMDFSGELWDHPTRLFDATMDVNARSIYLGTKHAANSMLKRPRTASNTAAIINTSSVAGLTGSMGGFAYTTSKHAVNGATKWAAQKLAPSIRVNSVHPGSIETNLQDPLLARSSDSENEKNKKMIESWHPMARIARPEEVANMVLFLASDAAGFCTGGQYTVDGGVLAVSGMA